MTSNGLSSELKDFLQKFPETRFMDVFAPDNNGILRGKRIQVEEFSKVFGEGSNYVASTPLMNVMGDIPASIVYGNDDGDPDLLSTAVPGSLAPVPWASLPTAQCLLELNELDGSPWFLDLRNVLRIKPGAIVLLLDGCGQCCEVQLEQLQSKQATTRVLRRWQESEAILPITLLQALPKGDKFDLVLQKGTELGVSCFQPIETEHSIPNLNAARLSKREQRWQRSGWNLRGR